MPFARIALNVGVSAANKWYFRKGMAQYAISSFDDALHWLVYTAMRKSDPMPGLVESSCAYRYLYSGLLSAPPRDRGSQCLGSSLFPLVGAQQ